VRSISSNLGIIDRTARYYSLKNANSHLGYSITR
jgi:hypothetical protein